MNGLSGGSSGGLSGGSSGGLFGGLFGRGAAAAATGDRAWLRAMLDAEAALARAQARAGLIASTAADAIARACRPEDYDIEEIGRAAATTANPVVPLVRALRDKVGVDAAGAVHRGATSQDILDTAAMLVAGRALDPLLADLAGVADACARLARAHRDTPMAGRTLMQQAVPTTFGLTAAGWLTAVDAARVRLAYVRDNRLAAQLGGAAGTMAALGAGGVTVLGLFAAETGLAEPVLPWHTDRTRIADLAGALGGAAGPLGKIATDLILLAQTEVAEVVAAGGRGGSSAMPHKRNPVAAISAAACVRRVPGLVATLLAAMPQEHERAAGGWQAEWEPLTELLRLTGSAAAWIRDALDGLRIDADRMRRNLELTGGLLMAERIVAALGGDPIVRTAVTKACARAVDEGRPLRDLLLADDAVPLTAARLDDLLDPGGYVGSAPALVDRALAAHDREGP
ncbi:MAG TPA: 3-carboxy-cis,cis-muconate cycloisomerase [Streptosporangiaceae bacterium]|jgi:3-carboxy-cis,cis-muconate cycloisomerase|nr:3-carboxy-cis,cis-muconate cycloisomerase [Streptosporangiaceae bacterium]